MIVLKKGVVPIRRAQRLYVLEPGDIIDACYACATECELCAVSCLGEHDIKMMARCIKLDMDCALRH